MSNLSVFEFEAKQIRFVGTSDDPWWVAADVCTALDHSNPSVAIARLDEDEKQLLDPKEYLGSSSNQEFWAINESGLYSLILSSRKPQAKRFKKWITSVVLPAIRKTGSYSIKSGSAPQLQDISTAIDMVFSSTGIDARLVAGVKANQIGKYYPALKPAMEEAKALLSIPVENKLVRAGELANIYSEKTGHPKMSAQAMNKLLMDKGLQIKNPSGKNPAWLPTDEGKKYGQLVLDEAKNNNKTVQSLQWYPSVVEVI